MHLIGMTKDIKTSELNHLYLMVVIQVDNIIQITIKMRINDLTELIGRTIDINQLSIFIGQHVHRANTKIQRQSSETNTRWITLLVHIVYFEPYNKFYLPFILFLQSIKLRQIIFHTIPLHRPIRRKQQWSMR